MSAELRSKFAALHRQRRRHHMSEKLEWDDKLQTKKNMTFLCYPIGTMTEFVCLCLLLIGNIKAGKLTQILVPYYRNALFSFTHKIVINTNMHEAYTYMNNYIPLS